MSPARSFEYVEIGPNPFLKSAMPDRTVFFSTYARRSQDDPDSGSYSITASVLPLLWRTLRRPSVKLIVCEPTFFSPWHWRWLTRVFFDRRIFEGHFPLFRTLGPQLLRPAITAPIAIIDREDLPFINRNNFFLLDRCQAWFKRELPADRWRVFMKTGHANLPTPRYREKPGNIRRIEKLHPLSLGLSQHFVDQPGRRSAEKTTDVFFAGRVGGSSSLREQGLPELLALREQNIVVDIPEQTLPKDEFLDRMSHARLAWSPEGYGWDCFRHYESLACGSVPVINYPGIELHQPLLNGRHCFYYGLEPGSLKHVIIRALADHAKLSQMAQEGYRQVMDHHTVDALARYVVETTLRSQ